LNALPWPHAAILTAPVTGHQCATFDRLPAGISQA
jgi:hypothetical protein